jgi:hypothetical protein
MKSAKQNLLNSKWYSRSSDFPAINILKQIVAFFHKIMKANSVPGYCSRPDVNAKIFFKMLQEIYNQFVLI